MESYWFYARVTWTLLKLAVRGGLVAYYLACLVAIHLTIVLASPLASGLGIRTNARRDGIMAGILTASTWIFITAAVTTAAGGGHSRLWLVGLGLGLPLGVAVGWQVGVWQDAVSWAHAPGGLLLGSWRGGQFFVSRPYTVTPLERVKHLVCTGATGTGKSTLVRRLVLQDLRAGAGIAVIDPKDDLIDLLLPHVPENRVEDVILFDAADREHPLGLNPFAGVPPEQRSIAASELISVFRRYFADAWGARLEHVLRNVTLALLEVPGAALTDVPRLLLDRQYAQRVARTVTNPAVREFLVVEYEEVLKRRSDAIEPILNKVGPWLSYPELRNIISQPENAFDMRRVMDEGKVLFVRIPQGIFGEDVSNLLGSLLVARVQLAAQTRVDTPGHRRRPFFLYVDEFQNFATSSFTKILTEARSFGVGLVCVNQYPEQLSRDLRLALLRNAATFVETTYRSGRYTLEVRRQEDLRELEPAVYHVHPQGPLPQGDMERARAIREASRRRYGARTSNGAPASDEGTRADTGTDRWGSDVDEE